MGQRLVLLGVFCSLLGGCASRVRHLGQATTEGAIEALDEWRSRGKRKRHGGPAARVSRRRGRDGLRGARCSIPQCGCRDRVRAGHQASALPWGLFLRQVEGSSQGSSWHRSFAGHGCAAVASQAAPAGKHTCDHTFGT